MNYRPVWAEIDLKAVKHNIREIRKLIGHERKLMAVVKANGYGHGDEHIGRACLEAGADRLAVSILEEALKLRNNGFHCPIMILGWTPPEGYAIAIQENIILTIYNYEEAKKLNDIAGILNSKAVVHIKVDTGMSRIGLVPDDEGIEVFTKILALPNLVVEGVFSHFSKADEEDKKYSYQQLAIFRDFSHKMEAQTGFNIPLKHIANSAAVTDLPESYFDLVRPGVIIYGLFPSEMQREKLNLKPALQVRARISRVQKLPKGTLVSYGGVFEAEKEITVATIPIGYADGYSRALSGNGHVLYKGMYLPIIGKICMDQCMVDASAVSDIHVGDVVTLIGEDQGKWITVEEIAEQIGTINYEVICSLSDRVPRIYN